MSTVYIFAGQGAQFPGMAKDICDTFPEAMAVVQNAEKISGEPIREWLWNSDVALLARSDKSQLAITVMSLAIVKVLEKNGIKPNAVAGFSLGEYAALYTSGILSFEDTIRVVKARGEIMQAACEEIAGQGVRLSEQTRHSERSEESSENSAPGMAAIIGLTPNDVIDMLKDVSGEDGIVFPVNMNSPKQTVVAGTAEGLVLCEERAQEKGARRFVRLQVAGPFHSPLMKEAAKNFETFLQNVSFNDPKITFFSNVTGDMITTGTDAKKRAVEHITHPVLWTTVEAKIYDLFEKSSAESQEPRLLEIGPGKVLSGLWRDAGLTEAITSIPTGTLENIQTIIE